MVVFFSVLYNPTENSLENIRKANKNGFKSVVYLNSVDGVFLNKLKNIDAHILGDNLNVGLGKAFYEFEEFMKFKNYDYFIYFDQDTIVEDSSWGLILSNYELYFNDYSVGMLHYCRDKVKRRNLVINSGCLFSMNILKTIGFHDRTYFVEGLDYDFCLRLKIHNYKIRIIKCEGIDHESLQDGFSKHIFSFTIPLRIYNKQRMMDFNLSHKRLLLISFKNKRFGFFFFFLKSLIKQNFMEKISKLLKV